MLRFTIINNNSNGTCSILSLVRPFVLRLAIVVSVVRQLTDPQYTFGTFKICQHLLRILTIIAQRRGHSFVT